MLFGYFTLFVALVISAVAEFYSIVGLTSIFSAAFWPVVIMGAALGVGKVTAAVWLKLNWDRAKWTYKLYLVPAVLFLMFLTSMGIFGYLSKAHSDQSLVSGDVQSKIAVYDEKIKIAKENIDVNRKALKQLDEAVDQSMARSTSESGADKAIAIRRGQAKERARLQNEIAAEQKTINRLSEERAPIAAEVRKVEAEVGPIKYIAAMIYGDNPDANLLESAVRWVIIMIVAVFDPLALMLILAAQQSIRWHKEDKDAKITDEEFRKEIENDPELNAFFDQARATAQALDQGDPLPSADTVVVPNEPAPPADEFDISKHAYLNQPFTHFKNLTPMVYKPEAPAKTEELTAIIEKLDLEPGVPEPIANHPELQAAIKEAIDNRTLSLQGQVEEPKILAAGVDVVERPGDYLIPAETVKPVQSRQPAETAEPPPKPRVIIPEAVDLRAKKNTVNSGLTADNVAAVPKEVKAHFGISFPDSPEKGEVFLRVDYLPSRLFKFNGNVWIEIDKTLTDSYVYNVEYIKYMISEIDAGRLDADELSDSERDQITEFLAKNESSRNTP